MSRVNWIEIGGAPTTNSTRVGWTNVNNILINNTMSYGSTGSGCTIMDPDTARKMKAAVEHEAKLRNGEVPQLKPIERATMRAVELRTNANELVARLSAVADRLLGGMPGCGVSANENKPSGQIAVMEAAVDSIGEPLARAHDLVSALERL